MHDFLMWIGGIIATGLFGLIGWVFKMVFTAIKDVEQNQKSLSDRLYNHELISSQTFATKIDMQNGFDRIMNKLDKIDEKLDQKADK